jgi:Dolichyl-phosphate-mannose-protein mannosyltransferase
MLLGLALRLWEAARTYLNPDEILYFFLALPNSFRELFLAGLITDHPPLLFFLVHPVAVATSSETALRLIPVLAGTIFPWVVYRWLSKVWNAGAGLGALIILTLSPNLIALSAQMRGYTLELLAAALALWSLEVALEDSSLPAMILFDVSLWLAILSEYSAAWFAGAVAIYFLLRARDGRVAPRLWAVWAAGQLAALAIYGALYASVVRPRLAMRKEAIDPWLTGAFPGAHQNLLWFSLEGTFKQFAYASSSIAVGVGAAFLFVAALVVLWIGRSPVERKRTRILATLLVVPFLLACAGGLLKVHPYGRSRHTVILSLFVAAGVGIALDRILRSRPWTAGFAALALGVVWIVAAEPDQNNIAQSRHHLASVVAAIDYLKSSIPLGSLVLVDKETARILQFYLPGRQELPQKDLLNSLLTPEGPPLGEYRLIWRRGDFGTVDHFLEDLASTRKEFGLSQDTPLWVIDGGWDIGIDRRLRMRFPGVSLPAYRDFDRALIVFQTPPGI